MSRYDKSRTLATTPIYILIKVIWYTWQCHTHAPIGTRALALFPLIFLNRQSPFHLISTKSISSNNSNSLTIHRLFALQGNSVPEIKTSPDARLSELFGQSICAPAVRLYKLESTLQICIRYRRRTEKWKLKNSICAGRCRLIFSYMLYTIAMEKIKLDSRMVWKFESWLRNVGGRRRMCVASEIIID